MPGPKYISQVQFPITYSPFVRLQQLEDMPGPPSYRSQEATQAEDRCEAGE